MIVAMKQECTTEQVDNVVQMLDRMGLSAYVINGQQRTHIEVLGADGGFDRNALACAPMVDAILDHASPMLATDRSPGDRTREVPLGEHATVGGPRLAVIAGPCSVESRTQVLEIADAAHQAGVVGLRGGAFKPRTSPYSFQGHRERALEWLAEAREQTGLAIVTEVMRCEDVPLVARYADMLQIGSRNMHNTMLLRAVGEQELPVLLKRGWCATLDEFFNAAEYVLLGGNPNVVLCERGIRTHETYVRNTLALAAVPAVKRISRLPIIVDPSHGTGRRDLVIPMSYAGIACGADGLLIEAHRDAERAWTDAKQTLSLEELVDLMKGLLGFAAAAQRTL